MILILFTVYLYDDTLFTVYLYDDTDPVYCISIWWYWSCLLYIYMMILILFTVVLCMNICFMRVYENNGVFVLYVVYGSIALFGG